MEIKNIWPTIKRIDAPEGTVSKFVFTTNNAVVESVLYKYPTYEDRTVICCSTQSGCAVGCRFCGTGDHFVRSLTSEEIAAQPIYLLDDIIKSEGLNSDKIKRLQIMFMSMGEPMNNYTALEGALRILYAKYPNAKLLISTSAPRVFSNFKKLNDISVEIPTIGLQFSVHESTNENRKKLIPSPTMTLEEIKVCGEEWCYRTGRKPFFNYCAHDKNNSDEDVSNLLKHFNPDVWESTVSVICERDEHVAAANIRQRQLATDFMDKMIKAGYSTRTFDPHGQDTVGGGCGMLWYVQEWMRKNPQYAKPSKGFGLPKIHTPKAESEVS
jgi:23S rRNA (adenine2503-C2)-methyltransferase